MKRPRETTKKDKKMPKILICNYCGATFFEEDSINCPYCGSVSVSEKENE